MRRRVGYLLGLGGALLAVASYVFRYPALITVNGHSVDAFSASAVLGIVLMALGIVIVRAS
jgi:hypothetical protein